MKQLTLLVLALLGGGILLGYGWGGTWVLGLVQCRYGDRLQSVNAGIAFLERYHCWMRGTAT